MTRAFRVLALTLLLFGTVAYAGPQQKVSVLGLEAVVGADGQINPADTTFAKELTKELRSRVNNSKNYTLTKDTRELVDEKLMGSCGSEDPQCMAPIGKAVGADVVLYGNVKNAKNGGYVVTLHLVDVKKRAKINTDSGAVAAADTKNPGLGNWVREHYRKLANEQVDGTLVIIATGATDGRVLIGNDTRERLRSGRAEITLPEGRYKVGVEADGFKLWESETVTITAGERQELRPDLVKANKPIDTRIENTDTVKDGTTGTDAILSREGTVDSKSTKSSKLGWKIAAGVGFGGAAVTTALWIVNYQKLGDFNPNTTGLTFKNGGKTDDNISVSMFDRGDCGGKFEGTDTTAARNAQTALDDTCKAHRNAIIFGSATVVLAAAGSVALYMALKNDGHEERPAGAGRQKKSRNLIVTPVVSPEGSGATLRFDW